MTESFQPKFVDMVRVNCSTQGTGPLVCGPPVPGFSSFADTLLVGDTFYYSVQGVEKPHEREVGRGTFGPNNTISRQPIKGALTNFTAGNKTIALVAASEWYARVQQASMGSGGGQETVSSRAALKAVTGALVNDARTLTEAGREGLFVWDPAVPVQTHQADTREGVYVAPAATAPGAWVRRFTGAVDIRWFGYVADNATDVRPAIIGAMAYLRAAAPDVATGTIRFPVGQAYCSAMISVDQRVTLEGHGGGQQTPQPTTIRFPAGTTGFVIQSSATFGEVGTDSSWNEGGSGTIIRGLKLVGGYTFAAGEGEFHGIRMRGRASIEDCVIDAFQGNGVHIEASTGNGNANGWNVRRCVLASNRDGLFITGSEVNAGRGELIDATLNRRWGINDQSFLGNTYESCHTAHNGLGPGYGVIYNGRSYVAIIGQEAGASTNPPTGTDQHNKWWFMFAGWITTGWPTWTSGMTVKPRGGQYCTASGNPRNIFIGCYSEMGGPPSHIQSPGQVIGGLHGAGDLGGAAFLDSFEGSFVLTTPITVRGRSTLNAPIEEEFISLGNGTASGKVLTGNLKNLGPNASLMMAAGNNNFYLTLNNEVTFPLFVTGPNTTAMFGRWNAFPNATTHNRLVIADWSTTDLAQGRYVSFGTAAPAGALPQNWANGDLVFNKNPGTSRLLGWHCTAHTTGTFAPLYAMKAGEQTAITAAVPSVAAPTKPEFDALVEKLNATLAALRAVGVIAA